MWLLTPDGLAVLVFFFTLWRWNDDKDGDLASEIVDGCLDELALRRIDEADCRGLKRFVRDRIHLDMLAETTVVSSFISLASALEVAVMRRSYESLYWIMPFWMAVMLFSRMSRATSCIDRRQFRRQRRREILTFCTCTALAIILKACVVFSSPSEMR
jgi:hypothetical protein